MLKTIGRSGPQHPELLQHLLDCHARIRKFTELALRLGEPADAREAGEAAAAVHRYFTVALPLHAADEELSIAPRLLAASPAMGDLLHRMSAEHGPLHALINDALTPLWLAVVAEPPRHPELVTALRAPAEELAALFDAHIRPEEERIFPEMIARFTPEETAAVLSEMRTRRAPK